MEYLGAWGTLIHEKKLRSKISCQTPFKRRLVYVNLLLIVFLAPTSPPLLSQLINTRSQLMIISEVLSLSTSHDFGLYPWKT